MNDGTKLLLAIKVIVEYSFCRSITKGRDQNVNKTFIKKIDELIYDVEWTYKKKSAD